MALELGGSRVIAGRITLPLRGAWTADLRVDATSVPTGTVKLEAAGGLSLSGTPVARLSGVDQDVLSIRVVAGAGGLPKEVGGAFRSAQLRDPLEAITSATGETLASIDGDILALELARWSLGRASGARCIEDLVAYAGKILGAEINWRFLSDGKLWLGRETWPAAVLPDDAAVIERSPSTRRVLIGAAVPALLPGVELEDAGRVRCVEHVISNEAVRSIAWT
jgi:hypothetical protein